MSKVKHSWELDKPVIWKPEFDTPSESSKFPGKSWDWNGYINNQESWVSMVTTLKDKCVEIGARAGAELTIEKVGQEGLGGREFSHWRVELLNGQAKGTGGNEVIAVRNNVNQDTNERVFIPNGARVGMAINNAILLFNNLSEEGRKEIKDVEDWIFRKGKMLIKVSNNLEKYNPDVEGDVPF